MIPDRVYVILVLERVALGQVGLSPRADDFPCRYRPIILHAHLYKAAFSKKKALFTSKLNLNFKGKLVKCYIWSIVLCCAETWTLWKVDQKYLECFEV